ncbi:PREDICTED: probable palmitoyltransferase ZDHHC1 [Priapulus caudatus]|uniref:Palmitoyltransferase n=1 Tax=Priapulus caudatus TaxID=37621 RepID=A0ABM1ET52_PRICU|nr:PREDICTED: probable palmitoyltransferase ZDHHC1 [Priapulus caudatus]
MPDEDIHRQFSRKTGWSWPPHPLQITAWCFIAYFGVVYFGIMVPTLAVEWQPAGYIINGFLFASHIIVTILSCSLNPADPNLRRRSPNKPMPKFDRTKHKHVIENNRCYLCEVDVHKGSKHCSACNKCVYKFDHHCKWLNNCVGGRNYSLFITCVATAFVGGLVILAVCLVLFIGYFVNKWRILQPYRDLCDPEAATVIAETSTAIGEQWSTELSESFSSTRQITCNSTTCNYVLKLFVPVCDKVFLSVLAASGVLCLIALALLGHLLTFHIYLIYRGWSTYDYIMNQREAHTAGDPNELEYGYSAAKSSRANQVAPAEVTECSDQDAFRRKAGNNKQVTNTDTGQNNSEHQANGAISDCVGITKVENSVEKPVAVSNAIDATSSNCGIVPTATLTTSPIDIPRAHPPGKGSALVPNMVILPPMKSPSCVIDVQSPPPASDYNTDTAESLTELSTHAMNVGSCTGSSPVVGIGEGVFTTTSSGRYSDKYSMPTYVPVDINGMPNTVIPVLPSADVKVNGNAGSKSLLETSVV